MTYAQQKCVSLPQGCYDAERCIVNGIEVAVDALPDEQRKLDGNGVDCPGGSHELQDAVSKFTSLPP